MSAIDELHRLLIEAGAEYRFNDATKVFEWHFDGTDGEGSAHATEVNGGINIIACSLTPEQVIAATLGDGEYESKMDALLCQLTNGKWSMTRKYSLEFMESLVREEFEEAFAAESVCRNVHEPPKDTTFWPVPHFKCSECGATHVSMEYVFYCPNCGRKVVDE